MAFRGWWRFGGEELANSSRVVDHLTPRPPTHDAVADTIPLVEGPDYLYAPTDVFVPSAGYPHTFDVPHGLVPDPGNLPLTYVPALFGEAFAPAGGGSQCGCGVLSVGYDDSWPGLRAWLGGGAGAYRPGEAPWFNPAVPASSEFVGVWVMAVEGLDSLPVSRDIGEAVCAGGMAGPERIPAREVTFDVLVVGCTNAGARYGAAWMSRILRSTPRSGVDLEFIAAHPSDTGSSADELERVLHRVVVTEPFEVSETSGRGGGDRHRQASVLRGSFTLTALDPFVWGAPTTLTPQWTVETLGTAWGHAPDCDQPGSCPDVPMLLSEECRITPLNLAVAPIPVCGGCQPLCEVERRVWRLPSGMDEEMGVTVTVRNPSDSPLSLTGFVRECGVEDSCGERFPFAVRGLPSGQSVVADAARGRAYGLSGGERVRQVGIVSTPSGAPWRPPVVDGMLCWELVVDSAPGTPVDVSVTVAGRQP